MVATVGGQAIAAGGMGYFVASLLDTIEGQCPKCQQAAQSQKTPFALLVSGAGGFALAQLTGQPALGAAFAVGAMTEFLVLPWSRLRARLFPPPAAAGRIAPMIPQPAASTNGKLITISPSFWRKRK